MYETGEMVNIDGMGNRVAGSVFGHEKVYFAVSVNKLEPTLTEAVYRARNTAGPKNARRYKLNTPCAVKGDRCYDCKSSDRICNTMNITAYDRDELVGCLRILTDGYYFGTITELLVLPEYQNMGIGSRLLELARENTPTMLYFGAQNGAEEFYEKNG